MGHMGRLNISRFIQHHRNILFFRHTPNYVGYLYIKAVFKLYYFFRFQEKKMIRANITDFLEGLGWSDKKILRRVVHQAFDGIFMHYYEKMFSAYKSYSEVERFFSGPVTVEGLPHLDEALAHGKGVILVTAHWGGVEYIPWALAFRSYPLSVILEYQSEKLRQYLKEKNRYFESVELLNQSEVDSIWKQALISLQSNRVVMTQCDEVDVWRRRPKRNMCLFNRLVYYDNTIELMAKHTGATVMTAYMERQGRKTYHLRLEPIHTDGYRNAGSKIYNRFEYYVSNHPEQWYQWKKWQKMKVPQSAAVAPPEPTDPYQAVIFDLDNTLYYAGGLRKRVLWRSFRKNVGEAIRLIAFQKARKRLSGVPFSSSDLLLSELASRASRDRTQSGDRTRDFRSWYQNRFYKLFMDVLRQGYSAPGAVTSVLQALRARGVRIFCYSDYSCVAQRLEAIGLNAQVFEDVFSGEDAGELKPSAKVIHQVASNTGIPSETILMVGDRNDTDGQSADLAGCDFFRIHTDNRTQFIQSWSALGLRFNISMNGDAL